LITNLKIRNYQSIRRADLELGQFTILIGESDIGKSAVIRAIEALVINRPGKDFISHGQKSTGVSIQFEDHVSPVSWIKTASSTYKVDDLEFEKTGRTVPEEISAIVRLGSIDVGSVNFNVNIHKQMDLPYLVMESGPSRAKVLGELSGVNTIFLAIQEVRKLELNAKRLQSTRLSDLEIAKEKLDTFRDLPEQKKRLEVIQAKVKESTILSEQADQMRRKSEELNWAEGNLASARSKASNAQEIIEKINSHTNYAFCIETMEKRQLEIQRVELILRNSTVSISQIEERISKLEDEIGDIVTCPTCGNPV